MKEIKLTQGQVALVDDEDFDYLNQWKWCTKSGGNTYYAIRSDYSLAKTQVILMHRVIMKTPSNLQVDHVNHNGLDNQKQNLRNCTCAQNQYNQCERITGSSKYKGVSYFSISDKWRAQIRINTKVIHLGLYTTQNEAAVAYNEAALKHHKEYAVLNRL